MSAASPPATGPRLPIKMARAPFRVLVWSTQALKLLGFLGMAAFLASGRAGWLEAITFGVTYALTMAGVALGYHRMLSHHSFRPAPWLRTALAIAGALSAQGTPLLWPAYHRRHHQFSDAAGDPHSPHHPAGGPAGFFHAHTGWILDYYPPPDWERYVPDLLDDPALVRIHQTYTAWVWVGALAPAVVAGLVGGSGESALAGFCFGGWGRMFVVEQVVCLVNSWGHVYGRRPFKTGDRSANNGWLALLTFGDGWHNNHHAFPASARHGLLAGQPDPGFALIRAGEVLGVVEQVIVPSADSVAKRVADAP